MALPSAEYYELIWLPDAYRLPFFCSG